MPQTVNVTGQFGTLTTAQSVVCTLFASVTDQSVEVPQQQCHYLLVRFFSGKNGTGTDLGQASVDVADVDVMAAKHSGTLAELISNVFPPALAQN